MTKRRSRSGRHWVGTAGWSYDHWRGLVYPKGLKSRDWLPHYTGLLRSVELNASFYRLPAAAMMQSFAERTPKGFLFAVKGWRMITHLKRLVDCAEPLQAFLERLTPLGAKAGPILFQLPPRFPTDPERLEAFLALLPGDRRFAFEFRDPSWHNDGIYTLLRRHNAAFCPFELAKLTGPRVVTADFVYVRLHGRRARYRGAYDAAALSEWTAWLKEQMKAGKDVYVYFDNTDEADHAVRNAQALDALLAAP
jgi:uncharacterized protein YecE (DUF72 family)